MNAIKSDPYIAPISDLRVKGRKSTPLIYPNTSENSSTSASPCLKRKSIFNNEFHSSSDSDCRETKVLHLDKTPREAPPRGQGARLINKMLGESQLLTRLSVWLIPALLDPLGHLILSFAPSHAHHTKIIKYRRASILHPKHGVTGHIEVVQINRKNLTEDFRASMASSDKELGHLATSLFDSKGELLMIYKKKHFGANTGTTWMQRLLCENKFLRGNGCWGDELGHNAELLYLKELAVYPEV